MATTWSCCDVKLGQRVCCSVGLWDMWPDAASTWLLLNDTSRYVCPPIAPKKMLPTLKMKVKLLWLPMAAAMVILMLATVSMATDADPSGASVNIINGLNDTMVCHCWSGDDDFGQVAIYSRSNYYWKFDPNVLGNTRFTCTFLWKDKKQEFPVWEGSNYSNRPNCCSRGPCVYKVSYDGLWNANYAEADDNSQLAEEWVLYKPWVPNPIPQ